VAGRALGLEDGRILVGSMNQVVVDGVTPAVDDFRCLFGFSRRRAVLDRCGKSRECDDFCTDTVASGCTLFA